MCPQSSSTTSRACGSSAAIASLWTSGVTLILATDHHQRLDVAHRSQRGEPIMLVEVGEEVGDDVDRCRRQHVRGPLDVRGRDVGREGVSAGEREPQVTPERATAFDHRGPATER